MTGDYGPKIRLKKRHVKIIGLVFDAVKESQDKLMELRVIG
jgi:hypothetical protein